MVNFPTSTPDYDWQSLALLDLFLLTLLFFYNDFPSIDHVVVLVSIDFLSNSKWDAPFHHIAYDCSRADWDSFCDHLSDVPWEDIFKFSVSAAASKFCQWVHVGIQKQCLCYCHSS